jgi:hypothetical protein
LGADRKNTGLKPDNWGKMNKSLVRYMFITTLFAAIMLPQAVFSDTLVVNLGTSASYGVLSSTFANSGPSTITGDIGYTTLTGGSSLTDNGITNAPAPSQSGIDENAALSSLNNQICSFNFASGAVDLVGDTTHDAIPGHFLPGVYCVTGAMSIDGGGTITLDGKGTYIFKSTGAFTTSDNAIVVLENGADACDVFWIPVQATTIGGQLRIRRK